MGQVTYQLVSRISEPSTVGCPVAPKSACDWIVQEVRIFWMGVRSPTYKWGMDWGWKTQLLTFC